MSFPWLEVTCAYSEADFKAAIVGSRLLSPVVRGHPYWFVAADIQFIGISVTNKAELCLRFKAWEHPNRE